LPSEKTFQTGKTYENQTAGLRMEVLSIGPARKTMRTSYGKVRIRSLNGCEYAHPFGNDRPAVLADRAIEREAMKPNTRMTQRIGVWAISAVVPHWQTTTLPRQLTAVPGRDDPGDLALIEALKACETRVEENEALRVEFEPANPDRLFEVLGGDGCRLGPSELYGDHERLLKLALEDDLQPFDTGWFGSQREIVSFRVRRSDHEVVCEASCSDDFDTEGKGEWVIHLADRKCEVPGVDWVEDSYDKILEALSDAWDEAKKDKKSKEDFAGFSIHPLDENGNSIGWYDTLILPVGQFTSEDDPPPGHEYEKWGFQDESVTLPDSMKQQMEDWAWDAHYVGGPGSSEVFEADPPVRVSTSTKSNERQEHDYGYIQVSKFMIKKWED